MKTSRGQFRLFIVFSILFLFVIAGYSQDKFPGITWEKAERPENLGYSQEKLEFAQKYSEGIKTAAVVIIVDGVILKEWGEVNVKFMTHSVRKSFLSALYGNYVKRGVINLDKTNVNLPEGTYSARGAGGHYILIIPGYNMVIVHRVNTFERGNSVSGSEMGKLTKMILDAKM